MYNGIKRILKTFIPKRTLFNYELSFRRVLYHFYQGGSFQCNICHKELRKFIPVGDGDRLCPFCGSLPRGRRLWEILCNGFIKEGIHILDFSPSRSLYRVLKNTPGLNYASTDISGDFLFDFQYDITDIASENDTFDLIICYHILEHIMNDIKAMQEMFRVLKNGGTCIIQTPFKDGDVYEDPLIDKERDRLLHFGQKDHVRIYSVDALKGRLTSCGFQVAERKFFEEEDNKFGFKVSELVLICTK